MNKTSRRGFLAGVMGVCAGLLVVGRFVKKPEPVADIVKKLVPLSDDVLVVGGEKNVYLISTWNGRVVTCGQVNDSQNWYMSQVNDPNDFDYSPSTTKIASTSTDGVEMEWFRG